MYSPALQPPQALQIPSCKLSQTPSCGKLLRAHQEPSESRYSLRQAGPRVAGSVLPIRATAPQIVGHDLKTTGLDPALRLLLACPPQRQIVGSQAPRTARAHEVTHDVEDCPHAMLALPGFFFHQREVRRTELPFCIGDVGGRSGLAGLGLVWHPKLDK